MRGLPLSPETKLLFDKSVPSDKPGKKSVWGEKEKKKTSPWNYSPFFESRFGTKRKNEMILKKKALPGRGLEDQCPRSVRLAKKQAATDAAAFAKKTPWGTWDLFMHKFRQQYSTCPSFIKRAYLEVAKDSLVPKRKAMFSR